MTVLDDEARDLFAGPNIAHIATLLPDGGPHSVPVMFDIEGDYLAFCREAYLVAPTHVIAPTFG
jgi:hypothetical protein